MGSFEIGVTLTAELIPPLVIGQDEDHIGTGVWVSLLSLQRTGGAGDENQEEG